MEDTSSFDEQYDFVVVGSGGGSMCAGLVARTAGKSVLILEKTDLVGGTTARSGGEIWIPNNPLMKRDGIEDSAQAATTYLDSVVGDHNDTPGASRERRQSYIANGPRMIEFLMGQGIKFRRVEHRPDYYDDRPGGSTQGRSIVAELFDSNELGEWRTKLRPNFLQIPAALPELFVIRHMKQSWRGKLVALKVGLRATVAKITGKRWITAGGALQGRMLQASLRAGIDIRVNSPVQELIVEGDAVKGVVAVVDGGPRRIGARLGVLVNAGGFAHNQEMRDRYQPGTSSNWSAAAPGDTGEMIEEMSRQGAAIAQMEEMVGFQITMPPGSEKDIMKPGMQNALASPHAIVVDQSGVRYQNEGGSYMAFCKGMLERNKTVPAIPSWGVVDTQFLRNYMFANTMPGLKKPDRWYQEGYLRKADTIEELAQQLKIPPAALKSTVDRFNGFVAKNNDEDFHRGRRAYDRWLGDPYHKPSATLGTIAEAPFYAVPILPGDVGTYGGVVTDADARVLRNDGSVIQGLYATGVSTASVMGRAYPGGGSSVGPSFVWGYVAAKHASNRENQPA